MKDHAIEFKNVYTMLLWLQENNIEQLPVTLVLHLGEKKCTH
jgi:hypothetical protein